MHRSRQIIDAELFSDGKLHQWVDQRRRAALAKITDAAEEALPTDAEEFAADVFGAAVIRPVQFSFDEWYAQEPTEGSDTELRVSVSIPFTGDAELLRRDANYRDLKAGNPRGAVVDEEPRRLVFSISAADLDGDLVKTELANMRHRLTSATEWSNRLVAEWNTALRGELLNAASARFNRLGTLRRLRVSMPIPIRPTPTTGISIPLEPRPLAVTATGTSDARDAPEWMMEEQIYEEIVSILERFAAAASRLPRSTVKLEEPDFRNFAVLVLNSHFKTLAAVGEAFNGEGKADILVPWQGRNVFVGEFKEYDGPKSVTAALDQLLGYVTWHDSKAALVPLIRRVDASRALTQIHAAALSHPRHLEPLLSPEPDRRRNYLFESAVDLQRRIRVAVIPIVLQRAVG